MVKQYVDDVSSRSFVAAWLFNFDVNKAKLKQKHKDWLDSNVVLPIELENNRVKHRTSGACSPDIWQIWIVGSASRTGSFKHNRALSKKRGEAVRTMLGLEMTGFVVPWGTRVLGLSEVPAIVRGRKQDAEHYFDRAVLVIAEKVSAKIPKPSPPKVAPPKKVTAWKEFEVWVEARTFSAGVYLRVSGNLGIRIDGKTSKVYAIDIGAQLGGVSAGAKGEPPVGLGDLNTNSQTFKYDPSLFTPQDDLAQNSMYMRYSGKSVKLSIANVLPRTPNSGYEPIEGVTSRDLTINLKTNDAIPGAFAGAGTTGKARKTGIK